ncbi:uncharacterized protein [Spinacia oleracea]|uniref:Ataxin-2 C-terminal domain-containing protein n=1 Tax=Spinacia oleracea TaxID=3562 RepID=A0ABM3QGC5_SPIOL|nr:uncharacterized protein LOC110775347 [Spinacia oleracea]XP_056682414.1 uncharacterized protein LOC110775347 [Spinacia oleracea]XP_056682415.1 uncharacterized protein LOC110775347 [Spinacia oleracea]
MQNSSENSQAKQDERSTVEGSKHESFKSDAQESNAVDCLVHGLDCLNFQSEELEKSHERFGERGSGKDKGSCTFQSQAQEYDASNSTHECEFSGEMERALQHQAQLIRSYEAQEKDQRDWEEKYGENNDSCEPGSHSDVTEERDENKAAAAQLIDHNKAGMQTKSSMTDLNSFKLSPEAGRGSSEKQNVSEMQPRGSPAPDFAFSVANSNQYLELAGRNLLHEGLGPSAFSDSASNDEELSSSVGTVLDALQEAKLLIKQQMNSLPETRISVGRDIETCVPSNRDVDWLKFPVGCPGLFRVPTDHEGQSLSRQFVSKPSGDSFFTSPDNSIRQPRFDFHFGTNISASRNSDELTNSNSSFPDLFPRMLSNQMMGSQFLGNQAGILPYGNSSFQNHDVRPNTYR